MLPTLRERARLSLTSPNNISYAYVPLLNISHFLRVPQSVPCFIVSDPAFGCDNVVLALPTLLLSFPLRPGEACVCVVCMWCVRVWGGVVRETCSHIKINPPGDNVGVAGPGTDAQHLPLVRRERLGEGEEGGWNFVNWSD